jgi:hypothetical protein
VTLLLNFYLGFNFIRRNTSKMFDFGDFLIHPHQNSSSHAVYRTM